MSYQHASRASYREHRRLVRSVTVMSATVALAATLAVGVLVLPSLADILAVLPREALLGLLAILSTATRVLAGVFGARRLRGRYGTTGRGDALPSVLLGAALAWAAFAGLVLLAGWGGDRESWWRLMLELPRWLAEAGIGALLVSPGPADAPDPTLRRYTRPSRAQVRAAVGADRDRGAASLEYAGFLFVVVLVVGSLITSATPIGQAIAQKICEALGASCGSSAAQLRAEQLGIKCVLSKQDRDLGYNIVYDAIRVNRKDTDSLTHYGDGSAQVVLSQGEGIGLDAGTHVTKGPAGWTANASLNADLGYVYRFPEEYGGLDAASEFLGERRNGWQQAAQIVLPGTQTVEEGWTRAWDWASNGVEDFLTNPSPAELAQRDIEQRGHTADAIEVSVSLQGEAGVKIGDGLKVKDANGADTTQSADYAAGLKLKAEVRGKATIGLAPGNPDSVGSSFTGSVKIDGEGAISFDALGLELPPFMTVKGQAGAGGSYTVAFDGEGNPTKLVLTGDYKYSFGGGGQKPGSVSLPGSADGKAAHVEGEGNEWQYTLDLDTSTPEGRLNREAFDKTFVVVSQDIGDGHSAGIVVLNSLNPVELADGLVDLYGRVNADALVVHSRFTDQKTDGSLGAKVSGFGLEGTKSSAGRTLVGATVYDNRSGGVETPLASCQVG